MLGNKGNIAGVGGVKRPENDLAAQSAQNDFISIDDTQKFEELAKELNMSPKDLRQSIDQGTIDPKKLIEALEKVSKVPGVSVDKARAQKEIDKAQLGKILDTVAQQLDLPNFDALIEKAIPGSSQNVESVINAVVENGTTASQAYTQLKPPSFDQALSRRLDKIGKGVNTAA
jgi:hypothetical protein